MATTTCIPAQSHDISAIEVEKSSLVTVVDLKALDDESERSFHNTDSAYVLPNE